MFFLWGGGQTILVVDNSQLYFLVTLTPTDMAPAGGYQKDQLPLGGTPCQVPC